MNRKMMFALTLLTVGLLGSLALAQVNYPDVLAQEVALYPGATIVAANDLPDECQVALSTTDDIPTVAAYYIKELNAKGWATATNVQTGPSAALAFTKDGRQISVAASSQGGQNMIAIGLSKTE